MRSNYKKRVKKMYNELGGEIYDLRYHEEQLSKYDEVLHHLRLSPYKIVLDLGCGTGLLLEKINGVYIGLDLSPNLISSAYQKARFLADKHLFQGDAENLPFRDDVFEVLLSFTLLQNLPEPVKALSELGRVSRRKRSICVTALRKAYSIDTFFSILTDSGFQSPMILDINPHDWIAIVKH